MEVFKLFRGGWHHFSSLLHSIISQQVCAGRPGKSGVEQWRTDEQHT